MFTQESESVRHYNIKRHFDAEGLLKVIGSHVHCKTGNISETVESSDIQRLLFLLLLPNIGEITIIINSKLYAAYRMTPLSVALKITLAV